MTTALTPDNPFDWDDLLDSIKGRGVIPILGKELLVVSVEGREVAWESHLAARLAAALSLDTQQLPAEPDLNAVTLLYLRGGGPLHKVHSKIKALVEESAGQIPEPLRKLAAITDFQLFVSTTFAPFIADAIDQVRFQGEPRTRRLDYSLYAEIKDLPTEVGHLREPHVYFLFGLLSATTDYAVTEEETLEFLHALQSDLHRPKLLFDAFKSNDLLFLGCSFPDWLARFFVRTINNERLLLQAAAQARTRVIADGCSSSDLRLALFLRQYKAEVLPVGSAVEFVDELFRRWSALPADHPASSRVAEPGGIFISYAREDHTAALALKSALDEASLDVWFDEDKLKSGEAWDREIRSRIADCAIFVPLLSRNAEGRIEGYFRDEWKSAIERARGFDQTFRFIRPIIVDDLPLKSSRIPPEFWGPDCNCVPIPGGHPSPEFVEDARKTIRQWQLSKSGRL